MLGLDKIARHGARKRLAEALEAGVQAYVEAARGEPNDEEHAPATRNYGCATGREILCGAGAVEVTAPRVNERRVDEASNRKRFKSVILPLYMRRSPKVTEADPQHLTVPLANVRVKKGLASRFRRHCVLECGSVRERRTENSEGRSWTRRQGGSDSIC